MPLIVPSASNQISSGPVLTYRLRHSKELQVKAFLKRDEQNYRKYKQHLKGAEERNFTQELEWFQEERWAERMPPHLRARRQRAGEML